MSYPFRPGGGLPFNHPTYIERRANVEISERLRRGEICYILGPRQSGKTSLVNLTKNRLEAEGVICIVIDLTGIGVRVTQEQWYQGIFSRIVNQIHKCPKKEWQSWWNNNEGLSPTQRLGQFIEEILLEWIQQPIVIFFDEIDSTICLNFDTQDFFNLIANLYNKRGSNSQYHFLTFCLSGVATPYELNPSGRVFDIGYPIELHGFEIEEVKPLETGIAPYCENPHAVLVEILGWTGGQPFLTQKLCQLVTYLPRRIPQGEESEYIAALANNEIIEDWENKDVPQHFRTIRDRLLKSPHKDEILELYREILNLGQIDFENSQQQRELLLSGIIVKARNQLIPANPIYQYIFTTEWLDMQTEIIIGGRYKVEKQIGRGGFGTTYLAKDLHMPNEVYCVLKKLAPQDRNPKVLEIAGRLFKQEAETLQKLGNHDQIPQLYAYFEYEGDFYLVLELIKGHDLTQELNKKWGELDVIFLLQDILPVLGFVHQHNWIHRDIKPANLMRRDGDGKVILIDFGALKEAIAQSTIVYTNAVGTPGYMPVEQLRGTPKKNSDLYALGVTCIRLMSSLTAEEIHSELLEATSKEDERINLFESNLEQVSPGFIRILEKMTRSNFHDRYQTVKEVEEDLSNLIGLPPEVKSNPDHSSQSSTIPVQTEIINNSKTKPKFPWLAGLVTSLFISGSGFAAWKIYQAMSFVPLCPPTFENGISWGGKWLGYQGEEIDLVKLKEATDKLNEACLAFGRSEKQIEKSISLLEKAIANFEKLKNQYPEKEQIRTYWQNSQLLLKHVNNALNDPQNYDIRPQVLGLAISIGLDPNRNDTEELREAGYQQNIGVNMSQAEFNENNERGRLVLLIDDRGDVKNDNNDFEASVKELAQKVPDIIVIGHTTSGMTQDVINWYKQHQIPLILATSTQDGIISDYSQNTFRVVPPNEIIGKRIAEYIKSHGKFNEQESKVVILYVESSPYSKDLSKVIQNQLPESENIKRLAKTDNDLQINGDIEEADFVVFIPNTEKRKEFLNLIKLATEKEAIAIGTDSTLNKFTVNQYQPPQCDTKGLLVFAPRVNQDFSRKVKNFVNPTNIVTDIVTEDWRSAYSYTAANISSKIQHSIQNNTTNLRDSWVFKSPTGSLSFYSSGERKINSEDLSEVKDAIDIFEVTPECQFRKQD